MSKDISGVISGWQFQPDTTSVRIITGNDGKDKIQLRLELGLLQMEFDGRPDGLRPEGFESWLDYYRQRQQEYDSLHPDSTPFLLAPEDCARLQREGIQYYQRYLSFWHLRRFELCARDTRRNLELFAFVREHAEREQDKLQFDQWRPYVTMMHAKAVPTPLVELRQFAAARKAIQAGVDAIELFLEEYDQQHRADQCFELLHLKRWLTELDAQRNPAEPVPLQDQLAELRSELERAVAAERFEDAARIRDEIAQQLRLLSQRGTVSDGSASEEGKA